MEHQNLPIDEEIAQIFKKFGIKINEARVFVKYLKGDNLSSKDIERITNLPQSEVSVALNDLLKKHWIEIVRLNTENKGRPVKIYRLALSIDEIFNQIGSEIQDQITSLEYVKERVKNLQGSNKNLADNTSTEHE